MKFIQDILLPLQPKLHNCFIGAVNIFPFVCPLHLLEFTTFDGGQKWEMLLPLLMGVFFNTFMSLTFGDSSSYLSLDINADACAYLPVEITVLKLMVTFKVN